MIARACLCRHSDWNKRGRLSDVHTLQRWERGTREREVRLSDVRGGPWVRTRAPKTLNRVGKLRIKLRRVGYYCRLFIVAPRVIVCAALHAWL